MESLEHKIGYTFQDRSLLQEALTHSSYANERHGRVRCNERMEFLGDAVLSIVSAELLYTRFPDMPEGQLSKLRSALVCTQSLAGFAARSTWAATCVWARVRSTPRLGAPLHAGKYL